MTPRRYEGAGGPSCLPQPRRHRGTNHLRSWAAVVHDALHEPADRHPAAHHLRPTPALTEVPWALTGRRVAGRPGAVALSPRL